MEYGDKFVGAIPIKPPSSRRSSRRPSKRVAPHVVGRGRVADRVARVHASDRDPGTGAHVPDTGADRGRVRANAPGPGSAAGSRARAGAAPPGHARTARAPETGARGRDARARGPEIGRRGPHLPGITRRFNLSRPSPASHTPPPFFHPSFISQRAHISHSDLGYAL
jgi:hypothetical protein